MENLSPAPGCPRLSARSRAAAPEQLAGDQIERRSTVGRPAASLVRLPV
jgi:hypothetical protein